MKQVWEKTPHSENEEYAKVCLTELPHARYPLSDVYTAVVFVQSGLRLGESCLVFFLVNVQ